MAQELKQLRVKIFDELSKIVDPEINTTITELELIDEVDIDDNNIKVDLHLTSPFCPAVFGFKICQDIHDNLLKIDGVDDVKVNSIKEKDLMRGGESEDVHEIVESIVIRKAGLKSGGRMHTARSRNDQVSLDMRMKMRDDILGICGGILDCTNLLLKLAEKHRRTIMPLYTHMQQAQTGTLSHYLLS